MSLAGIRAAWSVLPRNCITVTDRLPVPAFKQLFARDLLSKPSGDWCFDDRPATGQARDTAYAARLDQNVLHMTVDPGTRQNGDARGASTMRSFGGCGVLRSARRGAVPWVVVQGHTPIAGPFATANRAG